MHDGRWEWNRTNRKDANICVDDGARRPHRQHVGIEKRSNLPIISGVTVDRGKQITHIGILLRSECAVDGYAGAMHLGSIDLAEAFFNVLCLASTLLNLLLRLEDCRT